MDPLVSVVIPTYNRARLLMRAIASVQAQSYNNLEIIVVSDGSTDNTAEKVYVAQEQDARIRFLELKCSQGGSAARNAGIDCSHGELIAFLDDDDEWDPEKLRKQVDVITSNADVGLIYTGVCVVYVNEGLEYITRNVERGDLRRKILLGNCIGTTSSVLCRRALIAETGGFDVSLQALQDYDLWIRCCQVAKVEVLPEVYVNYYNYTQNIQISSFLDKYKDSILKINNKYKSLFLELSDKERKTKEKNDILLLFNKAMRNQLPSVAREYSIKLIRRSVFEGVLTFISSFLDYATLMKIRRLIR